MTKNGCRRLGGGGIRHLHDVPRQQHRQRGDPRYPARAGTVDRGHRVGGRGYILTFAGLLLAGGRLADAYGRRRLFLIGLAVFTASSLLAGFAGGRRSGLIAARALQGVGAALVTPTTLAIISATFTDPRRAERRRQASGAGSARWRWRSAPCWAGCAGRVSWEWIFWINVPVGLATMALGAWAIHGVPGARGASSRPGGADAVDGVPCSP